MYRNGARIGTVKHITAFPPKPIHRDHRLVLIIYVVEEVGNGYPKYLEEDMVMAIHRVQVFALLFSFK